MIKQVMARGWLPVDYTLSCGTESIEVVKENITSSKWASLFRGSLLRFDFNGLSHTVSVLEQDKIVTTVMGSEVCRKNETALDIKNDWEAKTITSLDYTILIKEGFHRTTVEVTYRGSPIFELYGYEFRFRDLVRPRDTWRIGDESESFSFERDVAILIYCIHWLDYGVNTSS